MDDPKRWRIDPAENRRPLSTAESAIYQQLYQFSQSPELDFDRIVEAVAPLPRIRRHLLRLANSLRRGPVQTISNLKHALVFIGASGIREAAEMAMPPTTLARLPIDSRSPSEQ